MLAARDKKKITGRFGIHDRDTGSADVQIAILSEEIKRLAGHLRNHPKDNHSRRGLLGMVARRRKLLNYLAQKDPKRYAAVAKNLGLKRSA